jgi:hypothetical protein
LGGAVAGQRSTGRAGSSRYKPRSLRHIAILHPILDIGEWGGQGDSKRGCPVSGCNFCRWLVFLLSERVCARRGMWIYYNSVTVRKR